MGVTVWISYQSTHSSQPLQGLLCAYRTQTWSQRAAAVASWAWGCRTWSGWRFCCLLSLSKWVAMWLTYLPLKTALIPRCWERRLAPGGGENH